MPQKGEVMKQTFNKSYAPKQIAKIIANESLLVTEEEKRATSATLYGDSKARITSNLNTIHDHMRISQYKRLLPLCKGKNVLHLGCGIGLLAMMIAKHASPNCVVGVDSSSIVDQCRVVAEQNGLTEPQHNLRFLRGSIRDAQVQAQLPVRTFDIVVSEWMGAFLTNESILLDDTLYCRENLLRNYGKNLVGESGDASHGVIIPQHAGISLVGITDMQYYNDTVDFWDNVYGFKMTAMKDLVYEEAAASSIPIQSVLTTRSEPYSVDIFKLDAESAADGNKAPNHEFSFPFRLVAKHKGSLQYLTFYVDAGFSQKYAVTGAEFSFSLPSTPGNKHNAWTEVSVLLQEAIPVCPNDVITGTVNVRPMRRHNNFATTVATRENNELSAECTEEDLKLTIASNMHAEISVTAECKGKIATIKTGGKYFYSY